MTARTTAETAAIFDHWAERYDTDLRSGTMSYGPLTGYAASLDLAGRLVAASLHDAATVLDVGIGTGAFADAIAQRHTAGNTLSIAGVDPSVGMRRRLTETHADIPVHDGDFLRLPTREGGWHAIVSSFAFHEVPPAQRPTALGVMAASIRAGGMIALLDITFASPAALASAEETADGWDPTETYHLVGDLDSGLRTAGFGGTRWWQTAPMHWLVIATKWIQMSASTTSAPAPVVE